MRVELTQFVRPDGRRKPTSCEIADELAPKVEAIRDAGLTLTAEVAGDEVFFGIDNGEEDLACEIAQNGPGENGTIATLERMIRNFERTQVRKQGE